MTKAHAYVGLRPHAVPAEGSTALQHGADDLQEVAARFGVSRSEAARLARARYVLRDAAEVAKAQPISWLVKGVLPQTGIAAIYGPSGSAKSFLAMDLAVAIASGTPWFNHRTAQRPVVYVCLEGEAGLGNRLTAHAKRHGTSGEFLILTTDSFDLARHDDLADLAVAIKRRGAERGMVIVDTLNRAAPGMDENSSAEMGRAIAAIKALQSDLGGLVLLVHHSGKDATKGMRGHSSLFAALDAAIEVTRTGDAREWRVAKSKDGVDGTAHAFKLNIVDLGLDEDGDRTTSCVVEAIAGHSTGSTQRMTSVQKRGMDAFMAAASECGMVGHADVIDAETWRAAFYRASTADSPAAKQKDFSRARRELVEGGHLIVSNGVYRLSHGIVRFPEIHSDSQTHPGHVPDTSRTGQDTTL